VARHDAPPAAAPEHGGDGALRRNWAGWYPDGEDLIFEQTGYDLRTPALGGLVGFIASLAVLTGLVTLGVPGEPIRNAVYGTLLIVAIIALIACATVARQALRPIHRIARFSRARQSLIVRDVLALGIKRTRAYPYAQLGQARTRSERALTKPAGHTPDQPRNYLLAYPVMHIELQRPGQPPLTLTTGALLSPHAAQRGTHAINAHFSVARTPVATPASPAPVAQAATPAAAARPRRSGRAIPPRPTQ